MKNMCVVLRCFFFLNDKTYPCTKCVKVIYQNITYHGGSPPILPALRITFLLPA